MLGRASLQQSCFKMHSVFNTGYSHLFLKEVAHSKGWTGMGLVLFSLKLYPLFRFIENIETIESPCQSASMHVCVGVQMTLLMRNCK